MKFKILTDRVKKFKKGEVIEVRDNPLFPGNKMMMNLVSQGEAEIFVEKKKKKVIKKSKKK